MFFFMFVKIWCHLISDIKLDTVFSSSTPLTKTSGIIVKEKVCKIPYGTFVYTLTSGWNKNQYLLNMSWNRTSGVMVSVLASRAVDRGFESRSGQTKDYNIGICCFSAKHAALRRKSKDWLARNQNNVSEWSGMSIRGLLFQWVSTIKIQL